MHHPTHWFVAYDQGAELRVSGWNTRSRLRAGAKHLCGQTCLHKLVDDFMARTLSARAPSGLEKATMLQKTAAGAIPLNNATVTSVAAEAASARPVALALDEIEPSARLILPPKVDAPAGPFRPLPLRLAVAPSNSAEDELVANGGVAPVFRLEPGELKRGSVSASGNSARKNVPRRARYDAIRSVEFGPCGSKACGSCGLASKLFWRGAGLQQLQQSHLIEHGNL